MLSNDKVVDLCVYVCISTISNEDDSNSTDFVKLQKNCHINIVLAAG